MADIESRVAVVESQVDDIRAVLSRMDGKLDKLTEAFQTRPHCPAPGSCIGLSDQVKAIRETLKQHGDEIKSLATWRTFMVGGAAVIGILWAVLNLVVRFFV